MLKYWYYSFRVTDGWSKTIHGSGVAYGDFFPYASVLQKAGECEGGLQQPPVITSFQEIDEATYRHISKVMAAPKS